MSILRQAAGLIAKGLVLAFGTALLVAVVVFFVPEGNDYALATVKKHDWLARDARHKIVFVGGSNLAFGLDSSMIEKATGSHVVNMGMNGYFGVRFMLEEVKAALRPSDVVVLSFEYDNFYKSVDGTSSDLLMVSKARPESFRLLSWKQRWGVVETMPFVAQLKLLRLVREAGRSVRDAAGGDKGAGKVDIEAIESLAGFEEHGDLTSHFGVEWTQEREDGIDISKIPRDAEVVGLMQAFAREMKERGVTVLVSYTPVMDTFYARHGKHIDALHEALKSSPPLVVPRPPSAFVFDEKYFFDTVYHLTKEGRAIRTRKVVEDLEHHLHSVQVLAR